MKCLSCDTILSDKEAVRKYAGTNEYLELCNKCVAGSCLSGHFVSSNDVVEDSDEEEFYTD